MARNARTNGPGEEAALSVTSAPTIAADLVVT
jgi:hypothetical protein